MRMRIVGGLVAVVVLLASTAHASVCTSADFGCAPSGTCVISGMYSIGDGCTLDFGDRSVEIGGTLEAAVGGQGFRIKARNVELIGGKLYARGDSTHSGGDIAVETSPGGFKMSGASPKIDVGGGGGGGDIDINAYGGVILLTGTVNAAGGVGDSCGDAGSVDLEGVAGPVNIQAPISANTGGHDCIGGEVNVRGQWVVVSASIDARGGAEANTNAIFLESTIGDVQLMAGAVLKADGTGQDEAQGASGGNIGLVSRAGDVLVQGSISTKGNSPDGRAGNVWISSTDDVQIDGQVNASGEGAGVGGEVFIEATDDLTVNADVSAGGGSTFPGGRGGGVEIHGGGEVAINAEVDASGAQGGRVLIQTGQGQSLNVGSVTVASNVRARGNRGPGGYLGVRSCGTTITGTTDAGSANGGEGGLVEIFADQIQVGASAQIKALPCTAPDVCVEVNSHVGELTISPSATLAPTPLIRVRQVASCPVP